jgi:hypothetical protein
MYSMSSVDYRASCVRCNVIEGTGVSAMNAKKTHCGRGHSLLDPKNLVPLHLKRGKRDCRTCVNERQRQHRAAKKVA